MIRLGGTAAGGGVTVGPVHLAAPRLLIEERHIASAHVPGEVGRFDAAVAAADAAMSEVASQGASPSVVGADVVAAHRAILQSDEIIDAAHHLIRDRGIGAEWALRIVVDQLGVGFAQMDDERFRERFADVEHVGEALLRRLAGLPPIDLTQPLRDAVVVGYDLSPVDILRLHRLGVSGFVAERGGPTSHTAIVARTLGSTFVLGVHGLLEAVRAGDIIWVDARAREVVIRPDDATMRSFDERRAAEAERVHLLEAMRSAAPVTVDGTAISIGANIESADEIAAAVAAGADHIGLVRTELLYLDRPSLPTEEDQYRDAVEMVHAASGRPVTFRTLDLGGDKLPMGIRIPVGPNPALGMRGIRFSLERRDVFRTQLRALYRAAAVGPVRILFPLISSVSEMRQARAICEEVCAGLLAEQVVHDARVPLGAMIETPSAAWTADHLAAACDFMSVGTNDLIQYAFAADRQNEDMAYLYQPMHPAIVRALAQVFAAADAADCPVSLCGDMAGDPWSTWLLVGLGLRTFSMAMPEIAFVKSIVRQTTLAEAEAFARAAMELTSAEEVTSLAMARFGGRFPLELAGPWPLALQNRS